MKISFKTALEQRASELSITGLLKPNETQHVVVPADPDQHLVEATIVEPKKELNGGPLIGLPK